MKKLCLVAVDVRSAHNVGSFLRTCDGLGASLILVGISPRPEGDKKDRRLPHIQHKANKEISKTALGAENSVDWRYFHSFEEALNYLKNEKFMVFALEQHRDSKSLREMNGSSNPNIAIVVGTEVTGLPNNIITKCDEIYEIEMVGKKESFNVSVAGALALYQAKI